MIKLLENKEVLQSFCDICGEKIKSLAISYGFDKPFCTYWHQIDDNGNITAAICKFGTAVTATIKAADLQELTEFINFIGFSELIAEERLIDQFNSGISKQIYFVEKILNHQTEFVPKPTFKDYTEIYNLLTGTDSDAIELGDFNSWYVDLSHRVRHGGAVAVIKEQACGIGLLSENTVIINGIAVSKTQRNKGYGKEILKNIESLGKSSAMAFCLESQMGFYLKCGYENKGIYKILAKGMKSDA